MIATRNHWRILLGLVVVLVTAAHLAPHWFTPPQLQENRDLAARPAFPTTLRELVGYRGKVDEFIADRFPPRPYLLAGLNRLRLVFGVSGSSRVIVGRQGYLFFDDGSHLGAARGDPTMSGDDAKLWLEVLAGRTQALGGKGARYLVVIAPTKEIIYSAFAPRWFGRPGPARATVRFPPLAQASAVGDVLYLQPAIAKMTARDVETYGRNDTHWTGYGAYAGYRAIMEKLRAMGVGEGPEPLSYFQVVEAGQGSGPRDLAGMLGVGDLVKVSYPHIVNPKAEAAVKLTFLTERRDLHGTVIVDTGAKSEPVLLMTRDSFSQELLPLLYPHFSRIVLAHNEEGFWRQDLIDQFKPDLVILETIEHGLPLALREGPAPTLATSRRIDLLLAAAPGMYPTIQLFTAASPRLLGQMNLAQTAQSCHADQAAARFEPGASVQVAGWLHDPQAARGRDGYVRLRGAGSDLVASIRFDQQRPDVSQALHARGALNSGFAADLGAPGLKSGRYEVTIYRRIGDRLFECPEKAALEANPSG